MLHYYLILTCVRELCLNIVSKIWCLNLGEASHWMLELKPIESVLPDGLAKQVSHVSFETFSLIQLWRYDWQKLLGANLVIILKMSSNFKNEF